MSKPGKDYKSGSDSASASGSKDGICDWTCEWIWIDQICINQADEEERCHRVDQMTELYSMSQTTIF